IKRRNNVLNIIRVRDRDVLFSFVFVIFYVYSVRFVLKKAFFIFSIASFINFTNITIRFTGFYIKITLVIIFHSKQSFGNSSCISITFCVIYFFPIVSSFF